MIEFKNVSKVYDNGSVALDDIPDLLSQRDPLKEANFSRFASIF